MKPAPPEFTTLPHPAGSRDRRNATDLGRAVDGGGREPIVVSRADHAARDTVRPFLVRARERRTRGDDVRAAVGRPDRVGVVRLVLQRGTVVVVVDPFVVLRPRAPTRASISSR